MLLTKGAKASARGPEGKTALMLAAAGGHTGAVNLLLTATKSLKNGLAEAQALIEERDEMGRTALMHGAAAGHAATVRALLLAGDSPVSPRISPYLPRISAYLPHISFSGARGGGALPAQGTCWTGAETIGTRALILTLNLALLTLTLGLALALTLALRACARSAARLARPLRPSTHRVVGDLQRVLEEQAAHLRIGLALK